MTYIAIRKNGIVVGSFPVPIGTPVYNYTFNDQGEQYQVEVQSDAPIWQPTQPSVQINYGEDVVRALQSLGRGLDIWSDAFNSAMTTMKQLGDSIIDELQTDVDFWRSRAIALETENQLLRTNNA